MAEQQARAERTPSPHRLNVVRAGRRIEEDVGVNLTGNRIPSGSNPTTMTLLLAQRREHDRRVQHVKLTISSASSTASISESILEYRKLHGRTYQNFNTGTEYWCGIQLAGD